MRLKRGVERASCDFCHGRKIKCDRASRAFSGQTSCSPCSLRGIQCLLDDSDDVRLRRRRRRIAGVEEPVGQNQPQLLRTGSPDVDATSVGNLSSMTDKAVAPAQTDRLEQQLESRSGPLIDEAIPSSVDQTPDFSFVGTPFELSPESILFLDQIFMGGCDPSFEYPEPGLLMDGNARPSLLGDEAAQNSLNELLGDAAASSSASFHKLWSYCGLDETTFNAALHAYFDLAAVHLPVLMEDAFWEDYHAGRCSLALVYAVACQGISFIDTEDKWDKQQRLASSFRESFLEARHNSTGKGAMRLDDLEALAVMVDWTYDETPSSPLQSQLGKLFLTHEALVLATLQFQMANGDASEEQSGSAAPLARLEERRQLLFWHVYGLDAFHSLDHKMMSRIPDGEDSHGPRTLPRHDSGSYLDAVLRLAIVAREILTTLVTVSTKRNGVRPRDVMHLYERLNRWQEDDCPAHLRKRRCDDGRLMPFAIDASSKAAFLLPLHCSILWLLQINCYMQIADCVSRYGLQDGAPFEAEITALRVDLEALRAVHDGMEISQWMSQHSATSNRGVVAQTHSYSLVDLAPSIARDICAGLCFWICERGKQALGHGSPSATIARSQRRLKEAQPAKQDVNDYRKAARQLRSAVATATSHRDTEQVLDRLDKQTALFEAALNSYLALGEEGDDGPVQSSSA
ncbi:hypothetical protein M419DRAFT_126082 [Trichoderma reesei RUT C-30]|uniref:Zn(2)-C6 fungal-type domain-containing protein n=1 Tax=Hypocrea jecorina (strain ATCC 56765 / BCRC 32924 / NRRL 11460 / Rut C-30) TaxID=1344414 RepID=A0A024SMU1_HYPJR|nr:hypothetical protein M419DRAFT_126082 [Trichoderma reesei RUT C-30]